MKKKELKAKIKDLEFTNDMSAKLINQLRKQLEYYQDLFFERIKANDDDDLTDILKDLNINFSENEN